MTKQGPLPPPPVTEFPPPASTERSEPFRNEQVRALAVVDKAQYYSSPTWFLALRLAQTVAYSLVVCNSGTSSNRDRV